MRGYRRARGLHDRSRDEQRRDGQRDLRPLGDTMPRFSSVSLGGGRAYLGTSHGAIAISGALCNE